MITHTPDTCQICEETPLDGGVLQVCESCRCVHCIDCHANSVCSWCDIERKQAVIRKLQKYLYAYERRNSLRPVGWQPRTTPCANCATPLLPPIAGETIEPLCNTCAIYTNHSQRRGIA